MHRKTCAESMQHARVEINANNDFFIDTQVQSMSIAMVKNQNDVKGILLTIIIIRDVFIRCTEKNKLDLCHSSIRQVCSFERYLLFPASSTLYPVTTD